MNRRSDRSALGFTFEECGGAERHEEVVFLSLPFAQGEWPENHDLGFQTKPVRGAGRVVLTGYRVVMRWGDNSVRLAEMTVSVDLERQSVIEVTPAIGSCADTRRGSRMHTAGNAIALQCIGLDIGCDGSRYILSPDADVSFGDQGHALLTMNGEGISDLRVNGSVLSLGDASLSVTFHVLNASMENLSLESIRIRVRPSQIMAGPVFMVMGNRSLRIPMIANPRFIQLSRIGELHRADAATEQIQYPLGGECRQNTIWMRAFNDDAGWTAAVRNFGENFPCACGFEEDEMYFDLWPAEAGSLVLPPGLSKTQTIGLVHDNGGADDGGEVSIPRIHMPLVPSISQDRLEILGCFPAIAPYRPKRYPKLESWTKWVLANRPRSYGYFDFGDEPNFSYLARTLDQEGMFSLNNEYDVPLITLTEFCRTGERLWFEDGRAAALHMMDIDTATTSPDPESVGGQFAHAQGHRARPPAPDHEWLEGLLLYYLLTGEESAATSARALADRIVRLASSGAFDSVGMTSRRYGWPLIALCAFYGFSREEEYLNAAKHIVEGMKHVEEAAGGLRSPYWGTPYWSLDTFMLGIAAAGLCRYHRLTGDEESREMILRSCDSILEMTSPEGVFYYKEYPLVRVPEPMAGAICCDALSYGFELTGNEKYLLACARNVELLLEMSRMGAMVHWNAEERVDVPPGAYMRARIEEITGQYAGISHRGIWPFLAAAEKTGLFHRRDNPFLFAVDRSR